MKPLYLGIAILIGLASCQRTNEEAGQQPDPQRAWLLEQKTRCYDVGRRYNDALVAEVAAVRTGATAGNPRYCYHERLNTCLYSGIIVGQSRSDQFVIDVLTNEELASTFQTTLEAFEDRRDELLEGCIE